MKTPTDSNSDNEYNITIIASDGSLSDEINITIIVTNENEAPTITTTTTYIKVQENNSSFSVDINATDSDGGDTITYTLSGNDESNFTISTHNSNGASIKFNITPRFENPTDSNKDNISKSP